MFYFVFFIFFLMIRRPPRSTRTDTLFPYTTLFRSSLCRIGVWAARHQGEFDFAGRDQIRNVAGALDRGGHGAILGERSAARADRCSGGFRRCGPVARRPFVCNRAQLASERWQRSEEQTSELPSLMRNSYAVFCLTKKTKPSHKRH